MSVSTPQVAMPAIMSRRAPDEAWPARPGFDGYLDELIHRWASVLAVLGFVLYPLFFVLDLFTMPKDLLPRFAWYRGFVTVEMLLHFLVIRRTRPGKHSYLNGYVITFVAAAGIVQMTKDLGGFNSSYYAGINLVIVGVNLLLPWRAVHSALNGLLALAMYVLYNAFFGADFQWAALLNNLYFMGATIVIA